MKNKINQLFEWIKAHSLLLKIIFLGSVLAFVVNQVAHIAQGMSWQDILETMDQQSRLRIVGMILIGFFCVLPMLLYDYVVVKVLEEQGKAPMKGWDWFVSAWVTNTINNLAGFGGVVGATLRANFYGKDIERKKVLAVVSKVALFLLSGLSILSLVTFVDMFSIRTEGPFKEYWIWLLVGSIIAPALLIFVSIKKRTLFKEFFPKGIVLLFGASLGQWLGSMTAFLMIGFLMQVDVSLLEVYPLFVVATVIGMLSMVPGGMGTFDVLIILGLSQLGVQQSTAVVWILYYRLFYYVLPFLTGSGLFIHQTGMKINRFFDNLPQLFSQKVAHFILVCALYFAGIMMVLLSTITNLSAISQIFQFLLPFSFDFLDQTLNMLVGILLLGLARAISMKVKKAYLPTIGLLIFGIVNTISRTTSLKLIIVYLIILLAVFLARKEFYREKFVYSWGALIFDGILFGLLFIIYSVAGYFGRHPEKTALISEKFVFFPSDDVWLSGLIGLGISVVALGSLYKYLTAAPFRLGENYQEERLTKLIEKYGGNMASHLFYIKDYGYFYYQEKEEDVVLFGYKIKANKCFIFGDPLGEREKWREATLAFAEEADLLGYQLVFYRVSKEYVTLLHDFGFNFVKTGEEGAVDFSKGKEKEILLAVHGLEIEHIVKQGYTFEMYPQLSDEIFHEIKRVSDSWLGNQKEKSFTVGRFDKQYLSLAPFGVMRAANRAIVGFITVKPIKEHQKVSYDLLRYTEEVADFAEDFLLANFIQYYQEKSFLAVDLGMAPLSNVGESKYAFLAEKIIHIFYKYDSQIYGFQDTRKKMERFVTNWEPCYISYRQRSNIFLTMIQLTLLIGRGGERGKDTMIEEV